MLGPGDPLFPCRIGGSSRAWGLKMKTFRVTIPVLLELEVAAVDPIVARDAVERAFHTLDPLVHARVGLAVTSSLQPLMRAVIVGARAQGPARIG